MKVPRQLAAALALTGIAAIVGFVSVPGHRPLIVAAAVMVALACVLLEMGRVAARLSDETQAWARVRATPALLERRPSDLEQLERVLGWGKYSPGDFNYEVRPLLRRLVAHRLSQARGIDVDARPDAARTVMSAELWDLVVAKEPVEAERVIRTVDIARMVEEIEEI